MKSLGKALDLLDALAAMPGGEAGISELGRDTGLDKAIVHRVLRTMLVREVVEQDPATRRYRLGPRLMDWAGRRQASDRPLELARPHLLALWHDTGETVHFTAPLHDAVLVMQVFESPQATRVSGRVGERVPMHCTASGKVFLALGDDALRERLLSAALAAITPKTLVDRATLESQLGVVRRTGIGRDLEECVPHANAVAAPVIDGDGRCRAAVAVIGPSARLKGSAFDAVGTRVVEAARAISEAVARLDPGQWRF